MKETKTKSSWAESLIRQIWSRGDAHNFALDDDLQKRVGARVPSPRFCFSDKERRTFQKELVTHYDFVWDELGKVASLVLYQGKVDGEVTYGAVPDDDLRYLGRLRFRWSARTKTFSKGA